MKKKEFLEYFCNYNIKNINVYYYYDINEFFYEIDLINPRTNPIDINDIYFEQEEQFIEFLVKHCKLNNIRYSLLAKQNNTYHENSYAIKNKKITLFQSIEPYYCIDSINPIRNYDISTPDTIVAELTGRLSLNIELLSAVKDALAIYTKNQLEQ